MVVDVLVVDDEVVTRVFVVVVVDGMPRYAHSENSDVPPSPVATAVTNQPALTADWN